MEELRRMMEKMMMEMTRGTQDLKSEMKELRAEMRRREEEWEKERTQMTNRIEKLEQQLEKDDRDKRRNNIIITGMIAESGNETETVRQFLDRKLEVKAQIVKARKIQRRGKTSMIVAEIESWECKRDIMKAKNKLKGSDMYIENDLTYKERHIQREIRSIAKEARSKGKRAKVTYRRVTIDDEEYEWNDDERGVTRVEYRTAKN